MARTPKKCYTAVMSKPILRAVLTAAAVVFALNLLLFSYGRHVVLPLLGALFLLAVCIGLGDALAAVFRVAAAGILAKAGLGWMAVTACFYLLCFFGLLNAPAILLFFAASLAVLGWRFSLHVGKEESRQSVRAFFSRPLSEYAVFLLPLVYAALPATFYDSLVYHLGIPNLYLQSGGFIPTPQFVYANTFIYYEISLIPAVFIGDMVPRLFHFLLGALFLTAVADEAVEHWGVRSRTAFILALVSLPMSLFLLATCKNDLAGALFIFLAVSRFRRNDWKLSAVFWGVAVGIKYFNLLPLALFVLVAFRPWRTADLKKLALAGLIVFLVVSPLLVKNLRFTGNPFFPFLHGVFPSDHWDGGRFRLMQEDVGVMTRTPADALRLPYDLSFFNHGYGGLVGPLFLVFLPFLLLGPVRDRKWLAWALLILACAPWLTASLRFVYIAFVVLAIFAVRACEAGGGKTARAVFGLLVVLNFTMGFAMMEKFYPAHALLGGAYSPEEYRERSFPAYPLFVHINRHTPPESKILLVGEARNFYLKRPYQLSSALDHCVVKRYLLRSRSAYEFIAAIRQDGFSYLAVSFGELERLQEHYAILTAEEKERLLFYLRNLAPVFHQGSAYLYKLG